MTKIHNNHWKEIDITLFENIPWFLPTYYHTLKITSNGGKQVLKPCKSLTHTCSISVISILLFCVHSSFIFQFILCLFYFWFIVTVV